jgi:hypothetical protein
MEITREREQLKQQIAQHKKASDAEGLRLCNMAALVSPDLHSSNWRKHEIKKLYKKYDTMSEYFDESRNKLEQLRQDYLDPTGGDPINSPEAVQEWQKDLRRPIYKAVKSGKYKQSDYDKVYSKSEQILGTIKHKKEVDE